MTSDKMPLMLDHSMPMDLNNVDDLFGDGVSLQLSMRSQGKQLQQRLDELRNRGCCQAVTWSKLGTIASLTPDGQNIELRFPRCHPEDGTWDLSEATICDLVKGSPAIPLVHLEWSPTHIQELAVIDAVGRVTIVPFGTSLNHLFPPRKWEADTVDHIHGISGCYWLPVPPPPQQKSLNVMYGPANKQGNGYQYESSFYHALGPCHPNPNKSAFFCIGMNGTLKMYWAQNNGRIEETTMELESVSATDELVTHASFSSDSKCLLAALVTSSNQLKLLKIEIQWAGPGSSSEKNSMPQNARLNPALVETHLASVNSLCAGRHEAMQDASDVEVSFVQVLPAIMDNMGSRAATPLVLTVRSRAASDSGFQLAQSILDRWEVVETRHSLDPAFEEMGRSNGVPSEPPSSIRLRRLDPVVIHKVVIGVQVIYFGKTLLLTMSDGSMEYRDRFTFEEAYANQDLTDIMSLRQAGWSFSDTGLCLHAAVSPSCCSMAQIGEDGKVRWNKLQYALEDIGNSVQDPHYLATIASISIATASAMCHQSSYDDLLAVLQPITSKKKFVPDWVGEIIRVLKIPVDYSDETHHDALMRNQPLQFCLGIMNSLGFKGESKKRSFQSKFSMINLNMRNVVLLITLSSNSHPSIRDKSNPLDDHGKTCSWIMLMQAKFKRLITQTDVVDALAGCAQWTVDLLSWLMDSLLELQNDVEFRQRCCQQRFGEMNMFLHSRNDVSLHLLLSSSSRSFLSAICRRVELLHVMSNDAMAFYKTHASGNVPSGDKPLNPQLQRAYYKIQKITSTSIIKVAEFEKLLNVLSQDIKQAYALYLPLLVKKQPSMSGAPAKQLDLAVKNTRSQYEMSMLLSGPPPPVFLPVIKKFFGQDLPAFRSKHLDPARLFFADFDLLAVQDDPVSLAARASNPVYVDTFKKVTLRRSRRGIRWRRCVRCTSVMEDVTGSRPGYTYILAQQRKCACGGHWGILPRGKLIL
ncbi:hypothetical protein E4U09_005736 [Claviceps aff. purpurea]|uniref:Mediator of RNA polymerase II transcription subunit 16 n=1 Tax=Claviceps aff. purpurea TaxID=1967640 RepID=A0A9P7QGB2_9HYPO|nr:hypothetical protein E4U09_005736 [Claviceps aff. purpurea]